MDNEKIVREVINKIRNDKKLNNKEKEYLLCIGNDWFLFKQRIDKAIEYIEKETEPDYEREISSDLYGTQIFEILAILKGEDK